MYTGYTAWDELSQLYQNIPNCHIPQRKLDVHSNKADLLPQCFKSHGVL